MRRLVLVSHSKAFLSLWLIVHRKSHQDMILSVVKPAAIAIGFPDNVPAW